MNTFFLYSNEKNLRGTNKFKMKKKRNRGYDNY